MSTQLLNPLHPHAPNYHLRQIVEHASKLLAETEAVASKTASIQGIEPFKTAVKFSAEKLERLKALFAQVEKPWSTPYIINPEFQILADRLLGELDIFRAEINLVIQETAEVKAFNKTVGEGISALIKTLGVKPTYTVPKPKSRKLFDTIELSAGYIEDIRRTRAVFENDNTDNALRFYEQFKNSLTAYTKWQKEEQQELHKRQARVAFLAFNAELKELYGFSLGAGDDSTELLVTSLKQGLELRQSVNMENKHHEFNARLAKTIENLYHLGMISYDAMAKLYTLLPVASEECSAL